MVHVEMNLSAVFVPVQSHLLMAVNEEILLTVISSFQVSVKCKVVNSDLICTYKVSHTKKIQAVDLEEDVTCNLSLCCILTLMHA